MDPDVGKWVQMCRGRVFDVCEDSVAVMGPDTIINFVAQAMPATKDVEEFRLHRIHAAGADARMHSLIYIVLRDLALKASAIASDRNVV